MNCQEFEELSGAYVLGAITSEERQAADEHLAGCTKCTGLLRELQSVVNVLPLAAPAVNPPPDLRERIFSSIRATQTDLPSAVVDIQSRLPPQTTPWWRSPRIILVGVIVLFALLGTMTAWNIALQQQLSHLSQPAPQITITQYSLVGTTTDPGVHGQLFYFHEQNMTMLVMQDLPQLEGVHVYQAWLMRGNQSFSIGQLNVKGSAASICFPGNLAGYDFATVSLEPGPQPSKDAPKGEVIATGPLTHPTSG